MNTENKSFTPPAIKDLWSTPRGLFNKLNDEFNFTLDVAASDENHLCDNYITEEMDGLTSAWGKSNWCNPPYSNIMPWVKVAKKWASNGSVVCMLVPADTSAKWFKLAYDSCSEVRFISGRISFINADTGLPVNGNNKGSVIFIWKSPRLITRSKVTLVNRSDLI